MATTTKIRASRRKTTEPKQRKKKVTRERPSIPSPEDVFDIPDTLLSFATCIYGESGIGKTSLISQIPDSFIIQCDPRRKGLRSRMVNIEDVTIETMTRTKMDRTPWMDIKDLIDDACTDKTVQCLIIDNFGKAFQHATNHVCWENGLIHPTDANDFGKTWNVIDTEVMTILKKYHDTGKGLVFLCHAQTKEVESAGETVKVEKVIPKGTKRCNQIIEECCDLVFFYGYDDGNRCFTIRNNDDNTHVWCKTCIQETDGQFEQFVYTDGSPIYTIPAGSSASEAWDNLNMAYENELTNHKAAKAERKTRRKKIPNP